ncbi:MAG: Ycf48-like protein [Anaerolineales bacterium]|nr:Ycf48-like protein [Anaerolineales bacterium]
MLEDGGGWAVGAAGAILRYDGEAWRKGASPTDETLHAVAFGSAIDGWAVGEAGTVLRYDGTEWRRRSAPTTAADDVYDIALTDDGAWAAGRRFNTVTRQFEGLILRFADGTWTETAIPQTTSLYAVAFSAPDQGWAVGKAGAVLRWDGNEWKTDSSADGADLYAVAITGSDVWATGEGGVFIHWDADGSEMVWPPSDVTLNAVAFASPDAGWSVGYGGTVLHYDGNTWAPMELDLPLDPALFGLFVDTDETPWVTGAGGLIGRVTSESWEFAAQPYLDVDVTSIDMPGDIAGWAVGSQPPPAATEGVVFWRYTEDGWWTPQHIRDAMPLFDVDILSEDEAWAVGQDHTVDDPTEAGIVWHYAAGGWQPAEPPEVSTLFAVEAVGPDDAWAAGQDGSLMHFNGDNWQELSEIAGNVHLYGLHFRTASDGWAVGERLDLVSEPPRYEAVAFHFDGGTWQSTAVPETAWEKTTVSIWRPRLLAVYALADDNVWAVGNAGAILHHDGTEWTVVQGLQDYGLLDVDFANPVDGWAIGTRGTILRYHGGKWSHGDKWSHVDSSTTATLRGVVSEPWGEAWVVGSEGAFLYRQGVAPSRTYLPLIAH